MRLRTLLLFLSSLLLAAPVLAQQPPPTLEGYRFFAFLNVTTVVEEPLPNVIRRELPELPEAWSVIEKYVATYSPDAFTGSRSRILKQGATFKLPLYRRPSELMVMAPPPPPPPEPAPAPKPLENIIGALVEADAPVLAVGSLGQRRELAAIDNVRRGDTLTTERGPASVRLLDGTTVLLRADSSVLLQELRFATGDSNTGELRIKLLKGAMRTISGMIPKDKNSLYALETPKGTVKVRGTDYALRICEAGDGCTIEGEAAPAGLYAGVLEGGIDLGNAAGQSPLEAGGIVRVDSTEALPVDAPEAAPLLFTEPELKLLPVKRGSCARSVGGGDAFSCGR